MKIGIASIKLLTNGGIGELADAVGIPWKGRRKSDVVNAISKIDFDEEGVAFFKRLRQEQAVKNVPPVTPATPEGESSALSVSYYLCPVNNPNQAAAPYVAECSDIQEALGMTHAEGEIFAALWRKCAARTLGRNKAGNTALRDSEKCYHYAKRVLSVETGKKID